MPTRNVTLKRRQESLIDALVSGGRHQDASEVMREGLRLVESREAEDAARLEALRAAIDVGIAEIERGEYKEFSSSAELVAHLRRVNDAAFSADADRA
jgi:antitoxin ParD1/3/4